MLCRIKDILYQDNGKGPYMTSKVGNKYDRRRGRVFDLDESELIPGRSYFINFINAPSWVATTPFIKLQEVDENIFHLETANSIYVLEKLNK